MQELNLETRQLMDMMREIKLFKFLKEPELKEVLDDARVCEFEKNEIIIREGETNPYFYAILHGAVDVKVTRQEHKDVYISSIGQGEIFGEGAIFLNLKRTANIYANDTVQLLQLERKKFINFINKNPSAGIKILMLIIYSLLYKLREANQEIAYERKSFITQDDIDSMIEDFFEKK